MSLNEIKAKFADGKLTKAEYIDAMHELHKSLFDYADFISSTDIQKIEIENGEVVMTSKEFGIKILCDRDDKRIAPIETLNFDFYEKEDSDMIYKLVGDGDQVLDIGANIGWYSLGLAKRFPQCEIRAFEPLPKTFSYLKKHVAMNGLEKNIKIYNQGFSNENAELTFYYYASGSGNASSAKLTEGEDVEEIKCPVMPLDDFAEKNSLKVDFIKCDVEGAELLVFEGGIKTLKEQKPIVFSEILRKWSAKFNYHPNKILDLFADLGYQCFVSKGDKLEAFGQVDDETIETNFYFLHKEKHADKISTLG